MRCFSSLSDHENGMSAAAIACARMVRATGGQELDFLVAFVSGHSLADFEELVNCLSETLRPRNMLATICEGSIGQFREFESRPGLTIWGLADANFEFAYTHIKQEDLQVDEASLLNSELQQSTVHLLLADPFSIECENLVRILNVQAPSIPLVGGLLSGGQQAGKHLIWINGVLIDEGALLAGLSGDFAVETMVAQGCRPIGQPMFVTACENNVVCELNHETPMKVLENLYFELSEQDQRLFRHSLFVGFEMSPFKDRLGRGDFLIRQVVGVDEDTGYIVTGGLAVEKGIVQFQLRDGLTAREDLLNMLSKLRTARSQAPIGSLVFSCLGRGRGLFGESNYESRVIASQFGKLPLAGMFSNGEVGPVNGESFVHGYTNCLLMFYDKSE